MLGDSIKKLRENQGLSQARLAEKIGISQKTISTWENGYNVPNADDLTKLANFFNTTISELMGQEIEPKVITIEKKTRVDALLDELLKEGIIKDPDDIPESVSKLILSAIKMDLHLKKLKQQDE